MQFNGDFLDKWLEPDLLQWDNARYFMCQADLENGNGNVDRTREILPWGSVEGREACRRRQASWTHAA